MTTEENVEGAQSTTEPAATPASPDEVTQPTASSAVPDPGSEVPAPTIPLEEKEENGYVPGTASVDQPGYAEELAARIVKSDFPVTRVAFLDYKALYNADLLNDMDTNNPLPLKTGQKLVVDKTPDCARATYWNHVG